MNGLPRSAAARPGSLAQPLSAGGSGGNGPLHIDPESAKFGGFDEPAWGVRLRPFRIRTSNFPN